MTEHKNDDPAATAANASHELADYMVMGGMKVPNREERESDVAASKTAARYPEVRKIMLELFRAVYPGTESDEEILAIDPNDFERDPSLFYEIVEERFGLPEDAEQDYFGGFGGRIEHTIAFITQRWDGKSGSTDIEFPWDTDS